MEQLQPDAVTVLMGVSTTTPADLISTTLASLAKQSLRPTRIIVAADARLHPTLEKQLTSPEAHDMGIIYTVADEPGPAAALDAGLAHVDTEYTARINPGDIPHPDRLRRQLDTFHQRRVDILGTAVMELDHTTDATDPVSLLAADLSVRTMPSSHNEATRRIGRRSPVIDGTAMARTTAMRGAGGYRGGGHGADRDLWVRMIGAGARVRNLPTPLTWQRIDISTGPGPSRADRRAASRSVRDTLDEQGIPRKSFWRRLFGR